MWEELRQIMSLSSIRSAEFLLAIIKVALGIEVIASALGPHRPPMLNAAVAIAIGAAFLAIASLQILGVLKGWARFRQAASLMATFLWLYFVGLVWFTAGTPQNVLVYIPLLVFNIMLFMRLSKLPFGGRSRSRQGGNE